MIQKEKIAKVIAEDATLRHRYHSHGQFCVIGGLLKAAGFAVETLIKDNEQGTEIDTLCLRQPEIAKLLSDHYGLTPAQSLDLQHANDRFYVVLDLETPWSEAVIPLRRKALLELLETL